MMTFSGSSAPLASAVITFEYEKISTKRKTIFCLFFSFLDYYVFLLPSLLPLQMLQSQAPEEIKMTKIIARIAPIITTGPEESPGMAIAQGLVGKRPLAPPYGATWLR